MDQLKRRFLVLGLSLLVLIIALAGLMGVLDILPDSASPAPTQTAVKQPTNTPKPTGTQKPATTTTSPAATQTPPIKNITPNMALSLPSSFNLDLSKVTSPGFSLKTSPQIQYPILKVSGAENTEYLKSITSSYFNGKEWQAEAGSDYVKHNGETLKPDTIAPTIAPTDEITITTLANITDGKAAIPTSLYTTNVESPTPLLYSPTSMTFFSESKFPENYSFTTTHYDFHFTIMAEAKADPSDKYLQLPNNITQRTRDLANQLTGKIQSPYYQAKAIETYLKNSYAYDFNFEPAPGSWEPNDWFLFEGKSGVCTNFNSAFVVLCRAAGIPARLAGGFHINRQEAEQVVYTSQAHAWAEVKLKDAGWITYDATGSIPAVKKTVTEITSVNPVATKGKEFTVAGTVWTDKAVPTNGGMVEILVNKTKDAKGAILVGQGIVADGRFEIKAVIPGDVTVGNYQVMAHSLKNAQYEESWSDPAIKVVTATTINLDVPARIKKGDSLKLTGLLTGEFGETLSRQPLKIYLNGNPAANITTDNSGQFTWNTTPGEPGDYTLSVSYPGSEFYLKASKEIKFHVVAPAVIELEANGNTTGKPVKLTGRLYESTTDMPLISRVIAVDVDNAPVNLTPATNDKGEFEFKYIFQEAGEHRVDVQFPGDDEYSETNGGLDLTIKTASTFSPWLPAIIAMALAAGGIGAWFLYNRRKSQPQTAAVEIKPVPERQIAIDRTVYTAGTGFTLTIDFPQIAGLFPDIWGIGDELTIGLQLTDAKGMGLSAAIQVMIPNERIINTTTDKEGKAEIRYIFKQKGNYEITARYEGENSKQAAVSRAIRIVDYREEIVGIYEQLINKFKEMGIPITGEYTPRKIQYLVENSKSGIPEKALDDATACFEETDYSLHPITRKHYEIMYLAQREINKHGFESAVNT